MGCCGSDDEDDQERLHILDPKRSFQSITPQEQEEYDRRHPSLHLDSEDYPTCGDLCFLCQVM